MFTIYLNRVTNLLSLSKNTPYRIIEILLDNLSNKSLIRKNYIFTFENIIKINKIWSS